MKRNRFGKIVATVGPASCSPEMLDKLFVSGVDMFRLNCSHGTHEEKEKVYHAIRDLGKKYDFTPAILADLQGPKLRVGSFKNEKIVLKEGDLFRFDLNPELGDENRVNLPHPEILQALKVGSTLLIDDGKVRVEAVECNPEYAVVKVVIGGTVSDHKGVNVPDVVLPIPAVTKKDREDLDFALGLGVDWVAISFVQKVEDVLETKKLIDGRAKLCAKIEKPSAIADLEEIVKASDAIMVARGDLAVETAPELVPGMERLIIDMCRMYGRPVIVATQMLESMITLPTPTRAEASDVATAVYLGADATMLSAESAAGKYPVEAVSMMDSIISTVEDDPQWIMRINETSPSPQATVIDGFASAVRELAGESSAYAIVAFTDDFDTVVRLSRLRPCACVVLATTSKELLGQAGLIWGVRATLIKATKNHAERVRIAKDLAQTLAYTEKNDNIVIYSDVEEPMITISVI